MPRQTSRSGNAIKCEEQAEDHQLALDALVDAYYAAQEGKHLAQEGVNRPGTVPLACQTKPFLLGVAKSERPPYDGPPVAWGKKEHRACQVNHQTGEIKCSHITAKAGPAEDCRQRYCPHVDEMRTRVARRLAYALGINLKDVLSLWRPASEE